MVYLTYPNPQLYSPRLILSIRKTNLASIGLTLSKSVTLTDDAFVCVGRGGGRVRVNQRITNAERQRLSPGKLGEGEGS